jgi:penicillin G amidase
MGIKEMAIFQDVLNSVATSGLRIFTQSRQPQKSGQTSLLGLNHPVNIYRDAWGVPHIYAEDLSDLMFAQGYVHAQDRLWQMEFNRRLVAGRLSEVLGQETLQIDRWMKILGLRRVSNQEISLLDEVTIDHFSAYKSGVNAFIEQKRLPVEFALLQYEPEPWCMEDSLSWIKMMSWNLSANWETELLRANLIRRLGEEIAAELEPEDYSRWPYILPFDFSNLGYTALDRAESSRQFVGPSTDEGIGSNSWVVSGSRTETGKPILANDMHLHMSIPAIWYENHLVSEDFEVTGVTFPGLPGVVSGHNRHIAWGFTNGFPDVQDLYMERLKRTEDGRVLYQFRDEWLEAQVIEEPILVKNGNTKIEEVVITRHGPIINLLAPDFAGEQPLALKWTSHEPDSMGNTIHKLNKAKNYPEFLDALRYWTAPVQNVIYADVEGNIAYYFPGKVPIRENGDGRVPAPGWTGEYEWKGYIRFEELPHIFNPPEGFIVTANNRVVDSSYPHFISRDFVMGDRAKRIKELIDTRKIITVDYIRQMHFDLVSPSAQAIAFCICQIIDSDKRLAEIIEKMCAWNGLLTSDSFEAAIYEVFIRKAVQLILTSKLGDFTETYMGKGPTPFLAENTLLGNRALEWLQKVLLQPESHWFDTVSRDEIIKLALHQTVDFLEETCGPDPEDWTWGKLHTLCFTHLLGRVEMLKGLFNRGTYPLGGDFNTVWATGAAYHDVSCERVVGPPFRFICDLENFRNSYGLLCPGQSGCPVDEHYDDQISAWFEGGYHPMYFNKKDVEENSTQHLILTPQ